MSMHVASPVKRISLEQTIVRKDGTREERGIVAYYHQKRICRVLFQLERLTGSRLIRSAREYHERRP